jgi:hypothetical protein
LRRRQRKVGTMRRMIWLALLIAAPLAGCASNPFETYYQGPPDARTLPEYDAGYAVPEGQIPVDSVVDLPDLQEHTQKLLEQGFVPMGQSQFYGTGESIGPEQVQVEARKIGAHAVLIYSTYRDTITVSSLPPLPDASTVFANGTLTAPGTLAPGVPAENQTYTELRSNFTALYFIKTWLQTGIYTMPITDAERRQLASGRGVKVKAVVQDSPAAAAGLQEGDFLVAVDGTSISGVADWKAAIKQHAGEDLALDLVRDGQSLSITIRDNTKGVDMRSNNP